ncbi:SUN domain-containing protein 3-like isoform X2 [Zophobas morio]|uniref:SUN domain-containing protein 3-like isoform X2 n=1 Tax=Zophobas morio TaxID=2755281 RepID=UPI003082D75B
MLVPKTIESVLLSFLSWTWTEFKIKMKRPSTFWYYFWQCLYLIPITISIYYCQTIFINGRNRRYTEETNLDAAGPKETKWEKLSYEMIYLRKEIIHLKDELEEIRSWKADMDQNFEDKLGVTFDKFYSDQIDYASDYAGGAIISTPNTISYPSKYGLRLFGMFDLSVDSEPHLILHHTTFPSKCYAFYGHQGRIQVALGRPVVITHVSLEHLRLREDLRSAPKDFEILGVEENREESLGNFVYDLDDSIIQTFRVTLKNQTFRKVELRILSNHGNDELTCVYRFRVHSLNLNLK